MIQEEKLLLTKDLCARLSHKVKCYVPVENCTMELTGKRLNYFCFHKDAWGDDYSHEREIVLDPLNDVSNNYIVKPYLRPLSSMTEEEKKKYKKFCIAKFIKAGPGYTYDGWWEYYDTIASFDYLNSIHVDYRGLIEKNLAIKVTKENNPYKNILI